MPSRPGIDDIFKHAENLDPAIVSVGDLSRNSTLSRYNLLERDEMSTLVKAGAVGDILCRFVDAEGNVFDHPLNDRVISVDPRLLRTARKIVLSSGGWEKAAAVRSALSVLKPQVLITDVHVAETLND